MWKSVKHYFAFCRLAFIEKFKPVWEHKLVKMLYLLAGFLIAVVLDWFLDVSGWQLVKPVIGTLSYQWWIIIILAGLVIFLLLLIDGARRFHERTTTEAKAAHDRELKENEQRAWRDIAMTETITIARTLYAQLDYGQPIPEARLAMWRSDALSMVAIHFGNDVAIKVFGKGDYTPPDSVAEQRQWLNEYVKELGTLEANQQLTQQPNNLAPKT